MAQYYMLNKPRGLLTARRDARCETVMRQSAVTMAEALRTASHGSRISRSTHAPKSVIMVGFTAFPTPRIIDDRTSVAENRI